MASATSPRPRAANGSSSPAPGGLLPGGTPAARAIALLSALALVAGIAAFAPFASPAQAVTSAAVLVGDLQSELGTFPGSGPDAQPGVIAMQIDDTVGRDVDRRLDGVLVVFNATPHEVTVSVDSLVGDDYELSPVLANGSDDVVQATTWDAETGTVTVPARTVTALVDDTERGHNGGWHWPWDWSWPWG